MLLRHLAPMIPTGSLLNELLSMPMSQRCHVLCFAILYLFSIESPTRFFFFLNKSLNCLWFVYRNFERYLFPAESSLTLDLWNKAIFSFQKKDDFYLLQCLSWPPIKTVIFEKSYSTTLNMSLNHSESRVWNCCMHVLVDLDSACGQQISYHAIWTTLPGMVKRWLGLFVQ